MSVEQASIHRWSAELEARHLADLRFSEVARALRALSSSYVERRAQLARGGALDGAGKRAAFALFYGPIHFLIVGHVVSAIGVGDGVERLIDLGCGTGASGAAAALALGGRPRVEGIDRHPWAVAEAAWTYRTLRLRGHARRQNVLRARLPAAAGSAIVAAFTLNELDDAGRRTLLTRLLEARTRGAAVLVVEPIAGSMTPWWDRWRDTFLAAGGRADEWRFAAELPDLVRRLDRAAGLDHSRLTAKSLWFGSTRL